MKTIAIVPVKGREPLLKHTISRLVRQVDRVIVAGHTDVEATICQNRGAMFYFCEPEMLLGAKWQLCADVAMALEPDALLIMGSSDMISDNWLQVMGRYLEEGYAMAGTSGIHFLDVQPRNVKRLVHWHGYTNDRNGEPIGTGRLISAKAVQMANGFVFERNKNHGLDWSNMQVLSKIMDKWGKNFIKCADYSHDFEVKCLSISTYKWENKHKFPHVLQDSASTVIQNTDEFLTEWFNECINLFNE